MIDVIDDNEVEVDDVEQEEEIVENPDNPTEEPETDPGEETEVESEEDDEDEVVVTIGDEEPEEETPQQNPNVVKKLRKVNRGYEKKIRELERQLKEKSPENKPVELGEKPTLESCGFDDKVYEQKLDDYFVRKRKVDEQKAVAQKQQEKQAEAWNAKVNKYKESKESKSFKDFDEAESFVTDTFSETQQGIMVQGAEDSALLVYALGKNSKKAKELAAIEDPVSFAMAVGRLEAKLSVKSRKKAPKPESSPKGGSGGAADRELTRLRAEAEKTGDYSKIRAYKKKIRDKK